MPTKDRTPRKPAAQRTPKAAAPQGATLAEKLREEQQRARLAESQLHRRAAMSMQSAMQGFDAASKKRWRRLKAIRGSGDYFLEGGVREDIRDLARDLYRNDGSYRCMVDQMRLHAIGDGLRPQARTDDNAWNSRAEELFVAWAKGPCDHRGLLSFFGIQRQAMTEAFNAGDVGAIMLRSGALQMVESELIRTPSGRSNDQTMHDGVETDAAGRVIRYHLSKWEHRGGTPRQPEQTVEARDMAFLMMSDRISQHRGIPATAPALVAFEHLHEFQEAHMVAAKLAAFWAGVIKTSTPAAMASRFATGVDNAGPGSYAGSGGAPGSGGHDYGGGYGSGGGGGGRGVERIDLQPGAMIPLSADESIEGVDTGKPMPMYEPFVKAERGFAAGAVGLSREVAFLEFGSMNYSSARAALLMARAMYSGVREQFTLWLSRIYAWKIAQFIDAGLLAYRPDYGMVSWSRPPIPGLDIVRERQANKMGIESNQTTLQQVCADEGTDWEEVLAQRALERQRERDLGIEPILQPGQTLEGSQGTQPAEPRTPGENGSTDG